MEGEIFDLNRIIGYVLFFLKHLQAIQDTCKGQPFHLAGYSFGSCIVEEMALLFQSRQSDDFVSLILLDGSHTWVPTVVDSLDKNQDNVELKTMNMVFESIGLDLKVS